MMKMKKLSLKWEKCPKEKLEKVVGGQSQAKTGKLTPKIAKCFFSFFKDCDKILSFIWSDFFVKY